MTASHVLELPHEMRYVDSGRKQACSRPGCANQETRLWRLLSDKEWLCRVCFRARVEEVWREQHANSDDELGE